MYDFSWWSRPSTSSYQHIAHVVRAGQSGTLCGLDDGTDVGVAGFEYLAGPVSVDRLRADAPVGRIHCSTCLRRAEPVDVEVASPPLPLEPQQVSSSLSDSLGIDVNALVDAYEAAATDRLLPSLEKIATAQQALDELKLYVIRQSRQPVRSPGPRHTWTQIATALGVSKQAVQRKFAPLTDLKSVNKR